MIKLGIVELDYHPEVLRSFTELLANQEVEVEVYSNAILWAKVLTTNFSLPSNFTLNLCPENVSNKTFISNNLERINKKDLLFFNTLAHDFDFYSKLEIKPKKVLRIHNANSYLSGNLRYKPIFNFLQIRKDLWHILSKTIFQQDYKFRRKAVQKMDYYSFPSLEIKEHCIKTFHLDPAKCNFLPMAYYDKNLDFEKKDKSDKIVISIIGKIDPRVRDYQLVYRAIKQVINTDTTPIKLQFLGNSRSSYGRLVCEEFEKLTSDKFEFLSFPGFIEQNDFEYYIQKTDFLLAPVKQEARYTIYQERFGLTKTTGNINDVIKYAKPALIPKFYPVCDSLQQFTRPFNNADDLAITLWDWVNNLDFKELDSKPMKKKYDKQLVQKEYLETFKSLTK